MSTTGRAVAVLLLGALVAGCKVDVLDRIRQDNQQHQDESLPALTLFELTSPTPTNSRAITLRLEGNEAVIGWLVDETSTAPDPAAEGWAEEAPSGYTVSAGDGAKIVYAWGRDSLSNVSSSLSLTVVLDMTPPGITEFDLTSADRTSDSTVTFSLSGDSDIAAWIVNESSTAPTLDNAAWSADKPVSHELSAGYGEKSVFAWAKDAADNVGDSASLTVGYYAGPSVSYPRGSTITAHEEIPLTFGEAMLSSSLSLGGSMSGAVGEWNTAKTELTIKPASGSTWTSGSGRTLVVNCDSGNGIHMEELTLTYDIHAAVCASVQGSDAGIGSAFRPYRHISSAIAKATGLGYGASKPAAIWVSGGSYPTSWRLTEHVIQMLDGVSLLGGFAPSTDTGPDDWSVRDPEGHETTIQDQSSSGGTSGDPNRALDASTDIATADTVVDGFIIKAGTGSYSSAIYCANGCSGLVISNNTITGGAFDGGATRIGVIIVDASPLVQSNTIYGGDAQDSATGIEVTGSSSPEIAGNLVDAGSAVDAGAASTGLSVAGSPDPLVHGNRIYGGSAGHTATGVYIQSSTGAGGTYYNNVVLSYDATSMVYGMRIAGASPEIRNNTVVCGEPDGSLTYLLYLYNGASNVDNNILCLVTDYDGSYCIYEGSANPASLRNNDLYLSTLAGYYYEYDTSTAYTSVSAMQTYLGASATANLNGDPAFQDADGADGDLSTMADNDFRLTAGTPASVRTEGLNGSYPAESWGFTTDLAGTARSPIGDTSTIGWSMGAYERN